MKNVLKISIISTLLIYALTQTSQPLSKFAQKPLLNSVAYAEDEEEKSEAEKQAEEKRREAEKDRREAQKEAEEKERERLKKEEEREREKNKEDEEYDILEEVSGSTPVEEKVITVTKTVYVPVEDDRIVEVFEPEKKVVYKTIIDPGFDVDTDKDSLVDGIDPNPLVHEKNFFTDSDKDGMADAFDKWHGEDDFFFLDDSDKNLNGILDSFE